MLKEKTNYEFARSGNSLRVIKDGSIVAQGFDEEESALKAIHVIEGSRKDFYSFEGGVVYRNIRVQDYKE